MPSFIETGSVWNLIQAEIPSFFDRVGTNKTSMKYLPQLTLIMSTSLLQHSSITLISVFWGENHLNYHFTQMKIHVRKKQFKGLATVSAIY